MKYTVIEAKSVDALIVSVNEYVDQLWEPVGGIAVIQKLTDRTKHVQDRGLSTIQAGDLRFFQAMVQQ
jgi:hypothetical protein